MRTLRPETRPFTKQRKRKRAALPSRGFGRNQRRSCKPYLPELIKSQVKSFVRSVLVCLELSNQLWLRCRTRPCLSCRWCKQNPKCISELIRQVRSEHCGSAKKKSQNALRINCLVGLKEVIPDEHVSETEEQNQNYGQSK